MNDVQKRIEHWLSRVDEALESNQKWLFALLLVAFAVKVLHVLESADSLQIRVPIMDPKYYDKTARDILAGNVVRREAFFMGPLYSYFLAVVYGIAGRDFTVVRLIQAAGGATTVLLTYFLGRRVFRPAIGLLGAVFLIFYGAMTFYETQILMMWLGTLLNLAVLLSLIRIGPNEGRRAYLLPGLLLGVSALARANILVFLPVALIWIVFVRPVSDRWVKAAVFAAATAVAVLPATIHNFVASRDFVPVTSNAGINFYIGNSEKATGIFYPPPGTDFVTDSTTRSYVERLMGRDMSPSEVSRYWFGKSGEFIGSNPGRALGLFGRKIALFFNGHEIPQIESYDLTRRHYVSLKLLFLNFWFLGGLGLFGLVFSIARWRQLFPLQGYVLAFALSIACFFVTARYRVQIAPAIVLFAAYAIVDVVPRCLSSMRRGIAVAGLMVLILLLTQPRLFALDQREVAFREHVHEGRRAGIAGDYQRALGEINKAVELLPNYHEGYVHRAIIHKEGKEYFKAIEDYTRALDIRPDLSSTHYDLGQTFRQVKLKRQAIEEYKKAIALDPLMIKAYNNLGITYAELGEYNDAAMYFDRVIRMDPSYVKGYNNLGAVLAENDRVEEAIAVFNEAVNRDPSYANSYKNLANAYVALKQVPPAIAALEKYLELVPDDQQAQSNLQKLYIAAGGEKGVPEKDR